MKEAIKALQSAIATEREYIEACNDDIVFYKRNQAGRTEKGVADMVAQSMKEIDKAKKRRSEFQRAIKVLRNTKTPQP